MKTKYVSFCGTFLVPEIKESEFAFEEGSCFLEGYAYKQIGGQDSLTVFLTEVADGIGHLVADCPANGWQDSTFVLLDEENLPIKSEDNFNPNPVPQVI